MSRVFGATDSFSGDSGADSSASDYRGPDSSAYHSANRGADLRGADYSSGSV